MSTETQQPPLEGLRVIDLSRLVAGNIVTHILADFGAEVIKVEKPGRGDDLRNWKVEGVSTFWKAYCRNKKSIALDFRQDRGMEILRQLIDSADVLVENFRPGTLEKMSLAPKDLQTRNPGLIVVRISGWGQTGIWKDRPGFGSLIEAMSGFASMNGFEDRPPVLPPLALADMIAGQSGATAVLMALRARDRDGKGQVIDLSLFEPMFATLGPQIANLRLSGKEPRRMGSLSELSVPRNIYETSDGRFVALSASTQAMAERVFRAIDRPELILDPRFKTNPDRAHNIYECDAIVAEFIHRYDRDAIIDLFTKADVTIGIVPSYEELDGHEYVESRGVVVEVPDTDQSSFPMHAVSPRLSRTPGQIQHIGPDLGKDGPDLLAELGFDAADILKMTQEGIIETSQGGTS
ncbi:CoA transferase (plasmid) [Pseudorhodobacter turbinis]|uniref:CoA transferase n=1 Tax=Pseudorhodobacter turbinis TaxID=2500533 RepID=A0A4P8EL36_9RHOB|nr:CoA transferase [Pseudorhodobacter turbinis]QCO57757.1 CoA transferase [Pseudorhodobacter turbinis]